MIDKMAVLNARVLYYSLFSKLFVFTYNSARMDDIGEIFGLIKSSPIDENSQKAVTALHNNVELVGTVSLLEEYDAIFHALKGGVKNTISYYDEGYEGGAVYIRIKKLIARTDIRKDEEKYRENEDNFGFVFALMSELLQRQKDGKNEYEELADELFMEFLNPFIDEFIDAIYLNEDANLYKEISTLMRGFFEFERVYYGAIKPQKQDNVKVVEGISRSETARRESNKSRRKGA